MNALALHLSSNHVLRLQDRVEGVIWSTLSQLLRKKAVPSVSSRLTRTECMEILNAGAVDQDSPGHQEAARAIRTAAAFSSQPEQPGSDQPSIERKSSVNNDASLILSLVTTAIVDLTRAGAAQGGCSARVFTATDAQVAETIKSLTVLHWPGAADFRVVRASCEMMGLKATLSALEALSARVQAAAMEAALEARGFNPPDWASSPTR